MAGRHSFDELRERMTPEARAAAVAEARRLNDEMNLAEVRRALKLSQDEIGQALQITPGSVAEIEERADMYLGTVRRFIEEIGGEPEIVVKFADRRLAIDTFAGLHAKE